MKEEEKRNYQQEKNEKLKKNETIKTQIKEFEHDKKFEQVQ